MPQSRLARLLVLGIFRRRQRRSRSAGDRAAEAAPTINVGLIVIAAGVVVVVLAALGAFIETRRQADAAWKTYVDATRAWVDVSIHPDSVRLKWIDPYHIMVEARVDAETTGISPAQRLNMVFVVGEDTGAAFPDIRKSCLAHRSHDVFVGFPGKTEQAGRVRSLGLEITYLDRTEGDTNEKNPANATNLLLEACATYGIVGDDRLHVTGRIYVLETLDPAKPVVDPATGTLHGRPIWTGENLVGNEILVEPAVAGDYAD